MSFNNFLSTSKDREVSLGFARRALPNQDMGKNHRLFRVELILTSDNDQDLRRLTDRIREETFPDQRGWARLGLVLLKIGQSEKVQQVYEILLEQATEKSVKAPIYNRLEYITDELREYQEAITLYEKSPEIEEKLFLRIILIWRLPTTTSVQCITTWVTIRNHFCYMNVL